MRDHAPILDAMLTNRPRVIAVNTVLISFYVGIAAVLPPWDALVAVLLTAVAVRAVTFLVFAVSARVLDMRTAAFIVAQLLAGLVFVALLTFVLMWLFDRWSGPVKFLVSMVIVAVAYKSLFPPPPRDSV